MGTTKKDGDRETETERETDTDRNRQKIEKATRSQVALAGTI